MSETEADAASWAGPGDGVAEETSSFRLSGFPDGGRGGRLRAVSGLAAEDGDRNGDSWCCAGEE